MRTRAQALQERKAQGAEPGPGSLSKIDFITHDCGLKVSRGAVKDGICPLCNKAIDFPAPASLPPEKPGDPDPWQLKPESVDTGKAEAKVETRVSTSLGADDKDLASLARTLLSADYEVPIPMLAKMTPKERNACSAWMEQGTAGPPPDCLLPWSSKQTKLDNSRAEVKPKEEGWDAGKGTFFPDRDAPRSGETVTVVWGEEKFGLKGSFSSCSVGPFTLTAPLLPGESRQAALHRATAELESHAERERERKLASFARVLKEAFAS